MSPAWWDFCEPRAMAVTTSLSWMNSSNWVRLRIRMHGCAAACAKQQRLEMELVDAVAPLRAGPVAVGALLAADSTGARRQLDARQLRPEHRHAHCYVIAIFRRQPGVADPVGQAEPAKNLHRTRRDLVALDVRRLAGTAGLGHGHIDAARGKFHR